MACYWVTMTAVVVLAYAWPAPALLRSSVAGLVPATAIVAGVMWHRPRRVWPWGLLAAAILIGATGDAVYVILRDATAVFPFSPADVLYVLSFPGAVAAILSFTRSGSTTRDRAGIVDAATVTLALSVMAWAWLIHPCLGSVAALDQLALAIYPFGDVLLLAAIARLFTIRRRSVAIGWLAVGGLAALVADLLYGAAVATGTWRVGTPIDIGWLVYYAAWGAAGLHPSMARLTEPEVLPEREINARRLSVVVLTSLAAPAVLLTEAIAGDVRDGVLLAVVSATIFVLNLTRVADAMNTHRRSLLHREHHDTLTGLANRALFSDRLTAALEHSGTTGRVTGVLLIDIDEFQMLNEVMGPSVGDEILVAVGRRLARSLGRHDVAARFGADEFAILVAGATTPSIVEALAERVSTALAEPIVFAGRTIHLTASIGVAIAPGGDAGTTGDIDADPLSQAVLALRAAQAAGRGQWCRYRWDLHGPMVERMHLRGALDEAVAEGAFTLRYQPIVALDSAGTVGFEALVRWQHATRGLLAPSEFIELAEESGLIEPLGDWVLRRAVTAAAHWYRAYPTSPYVSVNVSPRQFQTPGFADRVDRELTSAGLPPDRLMLELTEGLLLKEDDHVWEELATLRNTGVRLAIDDFGTGFSSLSYLQQTPIDVIKVDKSFVGTLATSERQRTLVGGIVRLAETLGLRVIAEGIENADDRDLLAAMGCPYGQGYLYSVPMTSAEVNRWLSAAASADDPDPAEYAHSGAPRSPTETLRE